MMAMSMNRPNASGSLRAGVHPQRRVFLPVAPSFVRKLATPEDSSSVDSGEDRRFSDVPSMGGIPRSLKHVPATPYAPTELPSFPAPAPRRPQPVRPVQELPNRVKSGRISWKKLFSPKGERDPIGLRDKLMDREIRVDEQTHESTSDRRSPTSVDDSPVEKRETPRRRHRRSNSDRVRWAGMACLPKTRGSRSGPRKHGSSGHESRSPRDRDQSSPSERSSSSYQRLPKMRTCGSCGVAQPSDVLNEPNSFAGFKTRPWYLYPEGSSVSSFDCEGSCDASQGERSGQLRSPKPKS